MNTTNNTVSATVIINKMVAQSERIACKTLYTAGWALSKQYARKEDRTLVDALSQYNRYAMGTLALEPAHTVLDMFTRRTLFISGEHEKNGVTTIFKEEPFYTIAKTQLDAGLMAGRARTFLGANGVKLRSPGQLEEMRQAQTDYYSMRDSLKPISKAIHEVMDSLLTGIKAVQERTLAKALSGTILAGSLDISSRKHLTLEQVQGVAINVRDTLDALRKVAFEPLSPITSNKQAKQMLKDPQVRALLEEYAAYEAIQLHRQRFWLAFALTTGDISDRLTLITPALLSIPASLEDHDSAMDSIGFYDAYERQSMVQYDNAMQPDVGDTIHTHESITSSQRLSETFDSIAEVASMHEVQDVYWDEHGAKVTTDTFVSASEVTMEELVAAGKVPVHFNRATAVEKKIERLQERKHLLDYIARLLGKRANDYDWVIEQSTFDLLEMKEDARKLMLPTAKEQEEGERVNPTEAIAALGQAVEFNAQGVRFF